MTDSYVQVPADSTGKKLDTEQLTVGANTVERERMQIAGVSALQIASVLNAAPSTEYGVVVRNIPSGTQTVSGTVTANAGTGPFPVSDNSGSLTIDAPVGTPVAARLSDGTAFLTTTAGRLSVDGSGVTQPISGTITANAGTGTFTVGQSSGANLEVSLDAASGILGDGASNTVNLVRDSTGAAVQFQDFPFLFNGTSWDRMRGDITNGLDVDVTRVTGTVTTDLTSLTTRQVGQIRSESNALAIVDAEANNSVMWMEGGGSFARLLVRPTMFNGSTWDRIRGDISNGLDVDVTRVQGNVTVVQSTPASLQTQVRLADQTKTILRAVIDFTTTGDNTIVAALAGNKTKVLAYSLVVGAATNLRWKSAATSKSGLMNFGANMGISQPYPSTPDQNCLETGTNEALILNQSGTAQVGGYIVYYQEA